MKVFRSARARWLAVGAIVVLLGLAGGVYVFSQAYLGFLLDAAALQSWLDQFGILAPLVFILIQMLQVIFAPIPGQAVALAAGYLFGAIAGTIYSMIGVVIGSAIAFLIARRYGRPAVESLLAADVIDRFDEFVDWVGVPGLLVFVLIPGLPDDAISFLAGLAQFRLTTFLGIIIVGRLPAYVLTVYAGDSLAGGELLEALLVLIVLIAVSVLGYLKQDAIQDALQNR